MPTPVQSSTPSKDAQAVSPATGSVSEPRRCGAPPWLWWAVSIFGLLLVAHTAIGLLLAITGRYSALASVLLALLTTALLMPIVARAMRSIEAVDRSGAGHIAATVVLVVIAGLLLYGVRHIGHPVVIRTDPGSYASTARFLERHGVIKFDPGSAELEAIDGIRYGALSLYTMADGTLEPQFTHGPSVVMATAFALGGSGALFSTPAAMGSLAMLAMYLAIACVVRSRVLAIAATLGMAVCAPIIFVTRAPFSEPFVLAAIAIVLALILGSGHPPWPTQTWILIGALVGSSMLFRFDAQLYLIAFVLVVGYAVGRRECSAVAAGACLGAAFLTAAPGIIDVRYYSGFYYSGFESSARRMDQALAVALVLVPIAAIKPVQRAAATMVRRLSRLSVPIAIGVVLLGASLWIVRPYVQKQTGEWEPGGVYAGVVARLQQLQGEPVDAQRNYGELSVRSLGWYLGVPLVALAVVGFGRLVHIALRSRRSNLILITAIFAIGVPLYLWDPKITPHQLWATRRYVPLIIPAFVIAAAICSDWLIGYITSRGMRAICISVLAVGLILPAVVQTWPIREMNTQRTFLSAVQRLCAFTGSNGVVLELGSTRTVQTFRSWCGLDAGWVDASRSAESIQALIRAAAQTCRPAFVVGAPDGISAPPGSTAIHVTAANPWYPERTLSEPPSGYDPFVESLDVTINRLPTSQSCTPDTNG
jgi:hypothetical protein